MVFVIPSNDFMEYKDELYSKYENSKSDLDSLYSGLTDESNPVLLFFYVRGDI